MPIYMDIHEVIGAAALDLAEAHRKDMLIQEEFHCKCMTYWLDESRGSAFCLIDAPDKLTVEAIHRKSHGLVPNRIIEVRNDVVESFLGRIHDPEEATISHTGLKVFSDPAFRILVVIDIKDSVLLRSSLGDEKARDLMNRISHSINQAISVHGGREVDQGGGMFIGSFTSASDAVSCAKEIRDGFTEMDRETGAIHVSVHGGEPVEKSENIFGDTIQMARRLSSLAGDFIRISSVIRNLLKEQSEERQNISVSSKPDEDVIEKVFDLLETFWQDSGFTAVEFCHKMSMSKSQLYRKIVSFWGIPPNQFLQEYRLDRSRELLRSQSYNITEVTFDSGFSSPSYFTKCFKKKFGMLPASYRNAY